MFLGAAVGLANSGSGKGERIRAAEDMLCESR